MEVNRIIAEIDAQIAKLQQARTLLAGTSVAAATAVGRGPGRPKGKGSKKGPGRPKGSKNVTVAAKVGAPRKRKISAEGRKRIAEAMKLRWAERKKQAATK
jgi:hypothetical protein